MEIHLLDMGTEKYGDCILITKGKKRILIDGGHPGDSNTIRFQLSKILKQQPPFVLDLLVVTHNHSDHIGCLPTLVQLGDIKPKTALLIDPKLRWSDGFESGEDGLAADVALAEALNEEDRTDMSDEEIEQFLFDAPRLGPGYQAMIDKLKTTCQVILYQGTEANYTALEKKFKDFGLKIVGPTKEHLRITQESLKKKPKKEAVDQFMETMDTPLTIAEAYRQLMNAGSSDTEEAAADVINKGAINNESIVLMVQADGWKALLAGDMQFARAEVSGLDNEMEILLQKVNAAGPYDFIKTAHHTSYNGLSEEMLDFWISQKTSLFAHTGGLNDVSHPEPDLLATLKARKDKITFARTDRNGLISVGKNNEGVLQMAISKGDFNNFEKNKKVVNDAEPTTEKEVARPEVPPNPIANKEPLIPVVQKSIGADYVEVTAKIPNTATTVKITVEVDPQKKTVAGKIADQKSTPQQAITANGRFDNLIFVTCSSKLKTNIGQAETEDVVSWIQAIPQAALIDIAETENVKEARIPVIEKMTSATRGIVIIGGYDVMPAMQLDVLDAAMRKQLTDNDEIDDDHDTFIVWSDDAYGDTDGDTFPEIPVSRIPDGKSSSLIFNALNAVPFTINSKAGIHNIKRPFAIDIYKSIPATHGTELEVSEKCSPMTVQKDKLQGAVYYMLHGSDGDATRFWGEKQKGGYLEAVDINNIPSSTPGTVVFSGCCWGALTVLPPAYKKTPAISLRPRTSEQSIALAYLNAGALAFVGCTGTHYSPNTPPYNFFGKPMHDAFWSAITQGIPPAKALFEAKKTYAAGLPHGLVKPLSQAIELKILRQFTCLGLGW